MMKEWIVEALRYYSGSAHYILVSKWIWEHKRQELFDSGDMFYKWQYQIRWLAIELRKQGVLKTSEESPKGTWILRR